MTGAGRFIGTPRSLSPIVPPVTLFNFLSGCNVDNN